MTISKEERAALVKLLTEGIRVSHLTAVAVDALPRLLNTLDAADERIAGLETKLASFKPWPPPGVDFAQALAGRLCSRCGERERDQDDPLYCDECSLRMGLEHTIDVQKSRIAELEAAAQWRPIEDAPKSEVLLVAAPGTCVLRAYWAEGEWRESRVYEPLYFTPTHFRSLPAAPIPALPKGGV